MFGRGSNEKPSLGSVLTTLLICGYAYYRIFHTDVSTGGRILFVALGIVGLLLFVAGLIVLLVPSKDKLAENGANLDRKLWSGVHKRRSVGPDTIRAYRLDQSFYDRTTRELEALQFRNAGDHVDVTGEEAMPAARAVIRAFVSPDGTIMAGLFDIRFRSWMKLLQLIGVISRNMRTMDLETELDDGSFITTCDSPDVAKTVEIPGIFRQLVPKTMPVPDKVRSHRDFVGRVIREKPGVQPVVISSVEEMFASQDRLQILKSNFRQSPQYSKRAEVESIAGRPLNEAELEWVMDVERNKAQGNVRRKEPAP